MRTRATLNQMVDRNVFLRDYAARHGPITIRGLYYQAVVAGLPGISKDKAGYRKVQQAVLRLRRGGRMPYGDIADLTRYMRKPRSYNSIEQALQETARFYRKWLWQDAAEYVEIWCEKDALAGVIQPVTELYDVPLMITRGFASETFCYEAVQTAEYYGRPYVIYYLGDFDRAGRDAANSLEEKLNGFATDVPVRFVNLAIDHDHIITHAGQTVTVDFGNGALGLPVREPKRASPAGRQWPYPFAVELDAIVPDDLRALVQQALENHLPAEELRILQIAEDSERTVLMRLVEQFTSGDDGDDDA